MSPEALQKLLHQVRSGKCSLEAAVERLAELPYAELGFAKVDHHRALRCGMAEVVFAAGKSDEDLLRIVKQARKHSPVVLCTRVRGRQARALRKAWPDAHENRRARTVRVGQAPKPGGGKLVLVVSAGTSDQAVAEEARETLEAFGARAEGLYDVGVAGLHRLLDKLEQLRNAAAVIVVAGMEGALPSVVGGLVACPVVAVPTSVGYGASFKGVAALLGMLNSCAAGVTVVNIDNGFGAAAAVIRMLGTGKQEDRSDRHKHKRRNASGRKHRG
ncbi:MAG: nickel pincer cofactor biosynthesis protein LarB [Planctomycetota bacterium]|nr:nickel pincer cofactor biosynthesis protein LarB [Planctomycetota bacterium]